MLMRPLTLTDSEALVALDALCFGAEAWSLAQITGSLSLSTTIGMACMEDNRIVGFYLAQKTEEETEIQTLGVHPDFCRRGLGRLMLNHILSNQQKGTVFLDVAADNCPARQLYESAGFTIFGTRPAYYQRGPQKVDAVNYRYLVKK